MSKSTPTRNIFEVLEKENVNFGGETTKRVSTKKSDASHSMDRSLLAHINYVMKLFCWNVRGMNDPTKYKEISSVLCKNNVDFYCLLETRV